MKLICIVGPTASGKTALSIELAKLTGGEIVSCDSMQIYRGMDIGTAKPNDDERCGIPHHMLDIADPSETYSAARYAAEAGKCIDDIIARDRQPIVAGGTGLYLDALLGNISFDSEKTDETIRKYYTDIAEKQGSEVLHSMLADIDPQSAMKIHANDIKRTVRALEVYKKTGKTMTEIARESKLKAPTYESVTIALCPEDREVLYERINKRVDIMMEQGLEQEAYKLWQTPELSQTALQAIGYKEMFSYFKNECTLNEAVEKIKMASRRYAKRQLTWFRHKDDIHWVLYGKDVNFKLILEKSTEYLHECGIII